MIKVENMEVFNIEGALRGMRNPMNSWDKSDSYLYEDTQQYQIGDADLELAQRLIKSGTDHSKFMRQIFVSMDITAPLYLWKEISTYKIATTANSTSTMHKLATTPITRECFSFDEFGQTEDEDMNAFHNEYAYELEDFIEDELIVMLETLRKKYLETGKTTYFRALIQLLPESWNQTRTWTANYAVLRNIYFARRNHKLIEWREFCKIIETLPYGKELICYE